MKCRLLLASAWLAVFAGCQLRPPPFVVQIPGTELGTIGQVLSYSGYSHSYDSGGASLRFCWGDGDTSEWREAASGETLTATHAWTDPGHYVVKVQAKAKSGSISDWLGGQQVVIYDSALVRWVVQVGPVGSACPAVGSDSTIYVATARGLVALTPGGAEKWVSHGWDSDHSPVLGSDGTIYLLSGGSLDAITSDGTLKWVDTLSWSGHSPAIGADGTIYMASGDSAVAVRPDGSVVWRVPLPGSPTGSPVVGDEGAVCYVVRGDTEGICVLLSDGTRKWTASVDSPTWVSVGDSGMFLVGGRNLSAVSDDGTVAWEVDNWMSNGQPVINGNGDVLAPCIYGLLIVRRTRATHYVKQDVQPCNPVLACGDSEVVVASNLEWQDGTVDHYVVFLSSGRAIEADSRLVSIPAVGPDGTVYVGTERGYLYALKGSPLASTRWPKFGHDSRNTGCTAGR